MLKIERGSTRAIIHVNPFDAWAPTVRNITHGKLTDYEFDHRRRRMIPTKKYVWFDTSANQLIIPINGLPMLLDALDNYGCEYEVTDEKLIVPRKIHLKMMKGFKPRSEEQETVINYLSNDKPFRKGLATATGSGKTVSTIASIVKYGYAAMIVVSGLHDQWYRQVFAFTNAKPEDVYVIQGCNSLAKLLESDLKPAIIIFSLETLRLYSNYAENYRDFPKYKTFIKHYGIGFKVFDEVHMNFHADTQIDLRSNIINNVYLTATFNSSNPSTRRIFELIYPESMRFGGKNKKKYIDVYCYTYFGDVAERKVVRMRGYMHAKYEMQLLAKEFKVQRFFDTVIGPIVMSHYVHKKNPGEKLLVFFSTIPMIEYATKWFKQHFSQYKVASFTAGDPDSVHQDNEIIISTPKKCGTGCDIKKLRIVLNTVSLRSPVLIEQLRGRLRELKDDVVPEYIELCDMNLNIHRFHTAERRKAHEENAASYKVFQLP